MNKQTTLWIATLFFLLMGLVQFSWAEPSLEEQSAEQAKEEQLQTNVPQTPEELLQMFKDLLADPDVDGKEFCEKRLGIDRRSWVKSKLPRTSDKEHLEMAFSSPPLPPAPFEFVEAYTNHQDKLKVLVLWFYKNPSFRITPALTRQILGETERIGVAHPRADASRGQYRVSYQYLTKKYQLFVTFWNANEANNPDTIKAFVNHTPEQIQNERERRKPFEVHKDYQPTHVTLRRIERSF
jgi:hypothetical protein